MAAGRSRRLRLRRLPLANALSAAVLVVRGGVLCGNLHEHLRRPRQRPEDRRFAVHAAKGAAEDLGQVCAMGLEALLAILDLDGRDTAMKLMKRAFPREHDE